MKLTFTESAWQGYLWMQMQNPKLLMRVNELIRDTMRNPFHGIGKPEPLKGELSGHWSRRITLEHRLIYRVTENNITIISCRYHYENVKSN